MSDGNVVGVIPARWASTRLPGKSLIPLAGKPLLQWVIERTRKASRVSRLLVATDDRRILALARSCGAEAVMTRPDHPSGTDRVAEAVADIACDVVINVQGDEPLIDPALIDRLADAMTAGSGWDMATAATPIRDAKEVQAPSVVKVVCGEEGQALYFSRAPIPHVRDEPRPHPADTYRRHIGIYAYRRGFLMRMVRTPPCRLEELERLEQLRALHVGARIAVLDTDEPGVGVDTPEDIPYVEGLIRSRHP